MSGNPIKVSKISVNGIDYGIRNKKIMGVNEINSFASIPNTKEQIIAILSESTEFKLPDMNPGDNIEITCIPTANFEQTISGDNIITDFEGILNFKQNIPVKIYINCYNDNNIFINIK